MTKILDATDTRTRRLQLLLLAGSAFLAAIVPTLAILGVLPTVAAGALGAAALALFVVAAGIRQRWEIEYRGHLIRFENSPVTAERLFLDEGLVARGGVGGKMELRAPIRVGEGAGETIVALADAGLRTFRLRIFVEGAPHDSPGASPSRPGAHPHAVLPPARGADGARASHRGACYRGGVGHAREAEAREACGVPPENRTK